MESESDYEDKRAKRAAKRRNNEKTAQSEPAAQTKNCCWTEEAKELYIKSIYKYGNDFSKFG